jgi:hypothetical protein
MRALLLLLLLLSSPVMAQDFPPESEPWLDPVRAAELLTGWPLDDVVPDLSEVIDVAIVWSPAANFGRTNAQAAITQANIVYANSLIRGRVRLVAAQSVPYSEASGMHPLNWITSPSNGRPYADLIQAQTGADVVHIVTTNQACGVGYLCASSSFAFTHSATSCTTSNLSFVHELGHNLCAAHDPANAGSSIYPYGFGHCYGSGRSVMAYPGCGGEPRRPFFSNPDVLDGVAATGTATRNNARVLNEQFAKVAGFRPSVTPEGGPAPAYNMRGL